MFDLVFDSIHDNVFLVFDRNLFLRSIKDKYFYFNNNYKADLT